MVIVFFHFLNYLGLKTQRLVSKQANYLIFIEIDGIEPLYEDDDYQFM